MPFPFFIGLALGVLAFFLTAGTMFGHGGLNKRDQFRVISELMRGTHGTDPKLRFILGVWLALLCAVFCFAGVFMIDAKKKAACGAYCGEAVATIGPNSDRDKSDKKTWHVVCICTEMSGKKTETKLSDLQGTSGISKVEQM